MPQCLFCFVKFDSGTTGGSSARRGPASEESDEQQRLRDSGDQHSQQAEKRFK
jgi:hypothetical protein